MFAGIDGPTAAMSLLEEVAAHWPRLARRAVVQFGDGSDPRALAIPRALPFQRTCWLEYPKPIPRAGRLLAADVAYVFGRLDRDALLPPAKVALPGRRETRPAGRHPCPRDEAGVAWLIRHFSSPGDTVLDPFTGSGTTLRAAHRLGRRAIGIEINPAWAREAIDGLRHAWAQATFRLEERSEVPERFADPADVVLLEAQP
jgi:hypothetical protein